MDNEEKLRQDFKQLDDYAFDMDLAEVMYSLCTKYIESYDYVQRWIEAQEANENDNEDSIEKDIF